MCRLSRCLLHDSFVLRSVYARSCQVLEIYSDLDGAEVSRPCRYSRVWDVWYDILRTPTNRACNCAPNIQPFLNLHPVTFVIPPQEKTFTSRTLNSRPLHKPQPRHPQLHRIELTLPVEQKEKPELTKSSDDERALHQSPKNAFGSQCRRYITDRA
jgi:hypothetical protein